MDFRPSAIGALLVLPILSALAVSHLDEYADLAPGTSHLAAPYADYIIFPGTTSPNGSFAVIYPNKPFSEDSTHDYHAYVVALHPFRVLLQLPDFGRVGGEDDLEVNWGADSSAAVVIEDGKWGPDAVLVISFEHGHAGPVADLTKAIRDFVQPYLNKKPPADRDDFSNFFFVSDDLTRAVWMINDRHQVVFNCELEADPNLGHPFWQARISGCWDIVKLKLVGVAYREGL